MKISPGGVYRDDRNCPDGGRCSHLCPDDNGCWRVAFCSPFSTYGSDTWTTEDKAANTNPPICIETVIVDGTVA